MYTRCLSFASVGVTYCTSFEKEKCRSDDYQVIVYVPLCKFEVVITLFIILIWNSEENFVNGT